MKTTPRREALRIIYDVMEQHEMLHVRVAKERRLLPDMTKTDRAFMQRLCEGTVEYAITLDAVINQFAKISVSQMDPWVRSILRMGVYQILFMDAVPDFAACDESVKLAAEFCKDHCGYINAILRSVLREIDKAPKPAAADENAKNSKEGRVDIFLKKFEKKPEALMSVKYSMPGWLCGYFMDQYGKKTTKKVFESFLKPSRVFISYDKRKISKDELKAELAEDGIEASDVALLDTALEISGQDNLEQCKAYKRGDIQIQDISSQIAMLALGIQGGETIIDVCAAPGGKTLAAAKALLEKGKGGTVISRDLTEQKTDRITYNVKRLGLFNVKVETYDATEYDRDSLEKADIVIADLPCSGIGIIGRKPDIKYNMSKSKQRELVELQQQILRNCVRYVKKGGILVYSTCTVNTQENEEQVKWIKERFDFESEALDEYIPEELRNKMTAEGMLQLLPGVYDGDGFFVARLRKK